MIQRGLPTGVLACLDGYMNIAIEQTEEYVNGQLKNKYGDAFLRGNNGKTIIVSFVVSIADLTKWCKTPTTFSLTINKHLQIL